MTRSSMGVQTPIPLTQRHAGNNVALYSALIYLECQSLTRNERFCCSSINMAYVSELLHQFNVL